MIYDYKTSKTTFMPIDKYNKLLAIIAEMGECAIAVSGGLDSMFLARTANLVLGDKALAIIAKTPYTFKNEFNDAKNEFKKIGGRLQILDFKIPGAIKKNPENRCFLCKFALFGQMTNTISEMGIETLLDGTNIDDLKLHRPGLKALKKLNVRSPLVEAGLSKDDIKILSKIFNYSFASKESNSCLLTRLPYNYQIDISELRLIEKAETYLKKNGFRMVRIKAYNKKCVIKVSPEQITKLTNFMALNSNSNALKKIGFENIKIDEIGYRQHKMQI